MIMWLKSFFLGATVCGLLPRSAGILSGPIKHNAREIAKRVTVSICRARQIMHGTKTKLEEGMIIKDPVKYRDSIKQGTNHPMSFFLRAYRTAANKADATFPSGGCILEVHDAAIVASCGGVPVMLIRMPIWEVVKRDNKVFYIAKPWMEEADGSAIISNYRIELSLIADDLPEFEKLKEEAIASSVVFVFDENNLDEPVSVGLSMHSYKDFDHSKKHSKERFAIMLKGDDQAFPTAWQDKTTDNEMEVSRYRDFEQHVPEETAHHWGPTSATCGKHGTDEQLQHVWGECFETFPKTREDGTVSSIATWSIGTLKTKNMISFS